MECSESGLRARKSPNFRTSGSTPSSTAGRSPRASPPRTAARSSSTGTWDSSPRCSRSAISNSSRDTSPSGTPGTRRRDRRRSRTPSRRSDRPRSARWRSPTTATSRTSTSSRPSPTPRGRPRAPCRRRGDEEAHPHPGLPRLVQRHLTRHRALRDRAGRGPHRRRAQTPAAGRRRVLARLHGREHALRRPRPAGRATALARPPLHWVGRRLGDRGPRHRRRLARARRRTR